MKGGGRCKRIGSCVIGLKQVKTQGKGDTREEISGRKGRTVKKEVKEVLQGERG